MALVAVDLGLRSIVMTIMLGDFVIHMISPDVVGASPSIAAPLFWPLVLMIYLPIIISFMFDLAFLALATCFRRLIDRIFTNYCGSYHCVESGKIIGEVR